MALRDNQEQHSLHRLPADWTLLVAPLQLASASIAGNEVDGGPVHDASVLGTALTHEARVQ